MTEDIPDDPNSLTDDQIQDLTMDYILKNENITAGNITPQKFAGSRKKLLKELKQEYTE